MTNLPRLLRRAFASAFLTATLALAAPPGDFTVESPVDGAKFRLADAKGKYVALYFLLKTECPFCLRHTRDYAKKAQARPEIVQVFLKPDSDEEIKGWVADLGETAAKQVSVYRDPDAALAKAFGVPDGYQFHGQTVHFPALILLDPVGKEVFRFVGKNNTDRFSFDRLVAKVDELKGTDAASPAKSSAVSK